MQRNNTLNEKMYENFRFLEFFTFFRIQKNIYERKILKELKKCFRKQSPNKIQLFDKSEIFMNIKISEKEDSEFMNIASAFSIMLVNSRHTLSDTFFTYPK